MNELFTNNSALAKVTEEDINIFSKVCEKGLNDLTEKNTEFTDSFKLSDDMEYSHSLKKFRVINKLESKQFCKAAISDRFNLSVSIVKNKVFLKAYQGDEVVLEISMSKSQLEAIEDKFYYDIQIDEGFKPSSKYHLFYAGTFMRNQDGKLIVSKLQDLRLIKLVNYIDL